MSLKAMLWAKDQRGLKPAQKLALICLADRHNPDHVGAWPCQQTLAQEVECSRSQLNVHLKALEEAGLLRREQRVNPTNRRQQSTVYILAFEDAFAQCSAEPSPEIGHGAVSDFEGEPCPENGASRVRNPDTNLIREPIKEPSRARGEAVQPAGPLTEAGILAQFAEKLRAGRYVPSSALTPRMCREMLERNMVTEAILQRAGLAW